jgi:hypothetical protein
MLCLDVSQDGRALVAVGLDASSRQLIVLWDISQLRYGGRVRACVCACLKAWVQGPCIGPYDKAMSPTARVAQHVSHASFHGHGCSAVGRTVHTLVRHYEL